MKSMFGVNSMGIMKTDITDQLVGIFNTVNKQINTEHKTIFYVHFRLTFMHPEDSNEQKENKKKGTKGGRKRKADIGRKDYAAPK